jgi:hypothetical protein
MDALLALLQEKSGGSSFGCQKPRRLMRRWTMKDIAEAWGGKNEKLDGAVEFLGGVPGEARGPL